MIYFSLFFNPKPVFVVLLATTSPNTAACAAVSMAPGGGAKTAADAAAVRTPNWSFLITMSAMAISTLFDLLLL